MAGDMRDDGGPGRADLKGSPENPGRDPKRMPIDKDSVGYKALRDSIVLIVIAWVVVFLTFFSLRNFNV